MYNTNHAKYRKKQTYNKDKYTKLCFLFPKLLAGGRGGHDGAKSLTPPPSEFAIAIRLTRAIPGNRLTNRLTQAIFIGNHSKIA